jgi:hypothetical protein
MATALVGAVVGLVALAGVQDRELRGKTEDRE